MKTKKYMSHINMDLDVCQTLESSRKVRPQRGINKRLMILRLIILTRVWNRILPLFTIIQIPKTIKATRTS